MGKAPAAAVALFVLGVAAPVLADAVVLSPVAGQAVRAGQLVEVRWDGIPAGTDEMELLLSLDDGASFPVRVTQELDGDSRSISWRVPNLPTAKARLLVRFESDGEEEEGTQGPAFRILGDPTLALERVSRRGGEVWVGSGAEDVPAAGLSEDRPGPTVRGTAGEEALLESHRDPVARPALSAGSSEKALAAAPRAPAAGLFCIDLPRAIPQRK